MTTTNLNPGSANGKEALDSNLSKVFAMICSPACPDHMAAVRSLLNLHRGPAERCPEGLSFDTRTVTEHVVEMAPKAADFVIEELAAKYFVKDPAAVQMSIRQQWVKFNDPNRHGHLSHRHAVTGCRDRPPCPTGHRCHAAGIGYRGPLDSRALLCPTYCSRTC